MHPIMVQLTPTLCLSRIFFFFKLGMMSTTDGRTQLCFSNGHSSDLPLSAPHLMLKRLRWGNKKNKDMFGFGEEGYRCGSGSAAFFPSQTNAVASAFQNRMKGKNIWWAHWNTHEKIPMQEGGFEKLSLCVYAQGVCFFLFFWNVRHYNVYIAEFTELLQRVCLSVRVSVVAIVYWHALLNEATYQGTRTIKEL